MTGLTVRDLLASLDAADFADTVKVTLPMQTTLGAHGTPKDLAALALTLGLEVDLQTEGGMWQRAHRLRLEGPVGAVRVVIRTAASVLT